MCTREREREREISLNSTHFFARASEILFSIIRQVRCKVSCKFRYCQLGYVKRFVLFIDMPAGKNICDTQSEMYRILGILKILFYVNISS